MVICVSLLYECMIFINIILRPQQIAKQGLVEPRNEQVKYSGLLFYSVPVLALSHSDNFSTMSAPLYSTELRCGLLMVLDLNCQLQQ